MSDERGIPTLNLMVHADNAAAFGFHDAIGYRRGGVHVLSRRLDDRPLAPSPLDHT
jgi:ribosomal protein S18 acetylase RimI-like enzyme